MNNHIIETLMIFLVLTNLTLLGSSRLGMCIQVVAAQGITLGLSSLFIHGILFDFRFIFFCLVIMTLKGFMFPWLLSRALREVNARREIEPYVGFGASILLGPIFLAICIWLSSRLTLPAELEAPLVVPVAFFTILTGLFVIVSRKKAITQVLGYIVTENGIYTFGIALAVKQPLLVEFGILLDVFVAVFVMGIMIFNINREFEHIDTDQLSHLRS
jgi:hydrogenase-4 component E